MTQKLRNRFRLKIRTTTQQRKLLADIRQTLAEHSYVIFTPAKWYRRNPHDYIAVLRNSKEHLLLIRPGQNGTVEVCRFLLADLYYPGWLKLVEYKRKSRKVLFKPLLPFRYKKKEWHDYIHPRHRLEVQLFVRNPLFK